MIGESFTVQIEIPDVVIDSFTNQEISIAKENIEVFFYLDEVTFGEPNADPMPAGVFEQQNIEGEFVPSSSLGQKKQKIFFESTISGRIAKVEFTTQKKGVYFLAFVSTVESLIENPNIESSCQSQEIDLSFVTNKGNPNNNNAYLFEENRGEINLEGYNKYGEYTFVVVE